MAENKILHAVHDGVHVLRLLGDMRYPLSPSLDHFLQRLFSEVTPQGFVVDLTDTRSIDSTNLGLLVRIAKLMQRRSQPRVTIISNREEINEVLTCLGFDKVFNIVAHGGGEPLAGKALALEEANDVAMLDTLLKAHQTLMNLNEQNKDLFRDVVAMLEKEQADKSSAPNA